MKSLPFETCWHRVARAEAHRHSLAKLWNSPDASSAYATRSQVDDNGAGKLFITPVERDWLLPFSFQFGELLYHLRGALDSCVYDAAVLKFGQDPPPDEQKWNFPVCIDPTAFNDAMTRMRKIPDDVRGLVESVQPYKAVTGRCEVGEWDIGQMLMVLNNWARIDRHRRLHVVGTTPVRGGIRIHIPPDMALEVCEFQQGVILESDSEIARFKIANYRRGEQINVEAGFVFDITVNETPRMLLGDAMTAMLLSVQIVREIFERHFGLVGQHYDLSGGS